MSMNYEPTRVTPTVTKGVPIKMGHLSTISQEDVPLLMDSDDSIMDLITPVDSILGEDVNYSPATWEPDVTASDHKRITDREVAEWKAILDYDHNINSSLFLDESVKYGIPRMKHYPLDSRKNVMRAIRKLPSVIVDADYATMLENINSVAESFGLETIKARSLNEGSEVAVYGLDKPLKKRTKEDIVKEHLSMNSMYYNNVFYTTEFAASVKMMDENKWMQFFFPNFRNHTFYSRLASALGGMALDPDMYEILGIRPPIVDDYTKALGTCTDANRDEFKVYVETRYQADSNWFKVSCDDLDHVYTCANYYSIMGEIMMNPHFTQDRIDVAHMNILSDWYANVCYHYDLYKDAEANSKQALKEAQYLHELFWNINDNPYSQDDVAISTISMIHNMVSVKDIMINMNESGEMVSKEECKTYLVHDLDLGMAAFLLPATVEYPIINSQSIKMAMDMINRVAAGDRKEYSTNLNRKYKEFGCAFSISVDHPYAKYADKSIIDNMMRVLIEGDTVVDDAGTSSGTDYDMPWFVRDDTQKSNATNLQPDASLGPNTAKNNQDFTRPEEY